ncbi:MAG: peptide chain release factor-like protein [Pirellulaceae bacterium]
MTQPENSPAVLLSDELLIGQCQVTFTRRGGPGGQHRNKVSSAVVLKHLPTDLIAEASERRSQAENRNMALSRLRIELALHVRQDVTSEVVSLVSQYGGSPFRVSSGNHSFAIVLTDVLNRVLSADGELQSAAEFWRTTPSQIIRFLKQEPRAFAIVNQKRSDCNVHQLK